MTQNIITFSLALFIVVAYTLFDMLASTVLSVFGHDKGLSIKDVKREEVVPCGGELVLQMRASALFGAKNLRFLKFMGCPDGRQTRRKGSILRNFVRTSFMDGPSTLYNKIGVVFIVIRTFCPYCLSNIFVFNFLELVTGTRCCPAKLSSGNI